MHVGSLIDVEVYFRFSTNCCVIDTTSTSQTCLPINTTVLRCDGDDGEDIRRILSIRWFGLSCRGLIPLLFSEDITGTRLSSSIYYRIVFCFALPCSPCPSIRDREWNSQDGAGATAARALRCLVRILWQS